MSTIPAPRNEGPAPEGDPSGSARNNDERRRHQRDEQEAAATTATTTATAMLYGSCSDEPAGSGSSSSSSISTKKPRWGIPMPSKAVTKDVVAALVHDPRPDSSDVCGMGPLLLSDCPRSSTADNASVVLGIDEAGRGCVLGPMVYGCAYWSKDVDEAIPKGFRDSKQMKEDERDKLFEELKDHPEIGYAFRSILPSEISRNMLRPKTDVYNLNQMSHDAAILLIRKIVDANVKVAKAYIDTVGNPQSYQRKLEREFPTVEFVVESKADANYAPCSAASVVAKVMRDRMLENWKFSESSDLSHDFGSGYPSDPKCKQWMKNLSDPVFGYPNIVRFSWAPAKQQLDDRGVKVVFRADLDDDDNLQLQQQKGLTNFLQRSDSKKRKRLGYFEKRKIRVKHSLLG